MSDRDTVAEIVVDPQADDEAHIWGPDANVEFVRPTVPEPESVTDAESSAEPDAPDSPEDSEPAEAGYTRRQVITWAFSGVAAGLVVGAAASRVVPESVRSAVESRQKKLADILSDGLSTSWSRFGVYQFMATANHETELFNDPTLEDRAEVSELDEHTELVIVRPFDIGLTLAVQASTLSETGQKTVSKADVPLSTVGFWDATSAEQPGRLLFCNLLDLDLTRRYGKQHFKPNPNIPLDSEIVNIDGRSGLQGGYPYLSGDIYTPEGWVDVKRPLGIGRVLSSALAETVRGQFTEVRGANRAEPLIPPGMD